MSWLLEPSKRRSAGFIRSTNARFGRARIWRPGCACRARKYRPAGPGGLRLLRLPQVAVPASRLRPRPLPRPGARTSHVRVHRRLRHCVRRRSARSVRVLRGVDGAVPTFPRPEGLALTEVPRARCVPRFDPRRPRSGAESRAEDRGQRSARTCRSGRVVSRVFPSVRSGECRSRRAQSLGTHGSQRARPGLHPPTRLSTAGSRRACITNHRTTTEDLDVLIAEVVDVAATLSG
jgi:hypothetical protein